MAEAPVPEREPARPWSVEPGPAEVVLAEPQPEPDSEPSPERELWPVVPPTRELLRDTVVPALTAAGVIDRQVTVEHGEARTTRVLRAGSGPPEVHVHIGRVEVVQGAPPTVPPAPAPARRPRPAPDHDAYLARRRESRR